MTTTVIANLAKPVPDALLVAPNAHTVLEARMALWKTSFE